MKNKKKAVYDPSKQYKWDPLDILEVSGQQFASFFHALTQEVNTPGGATILMKIEAYNVMMEIFKKGVEDGIIVESSGMEPELVKVEESEQVTQLFKS